MGVTEIGTVCRGGGGEGAVLRTDKRDPIGSLEQHLPEWLLLARLDEEVEQSRLVYAAVSQSA